MFIGNKDRNSVKSNVFDPPIRARYVRIYPLAWVGHMSLRAEFYGLSLRKYCTGLVIFPPVCSHLKMLLNFAVFIFSNSSYRSGDRLRRWQDTKQSIHGLQSVGHLPPSQSGQTQLCGYQTLPRGVVCKEE